MTDKSHITDQDLEFIASLISETFKDEAQTALKKNSSYRAVNTLHSGYKNQPVFVMWSRSPGLLSDK
jgi:hypothetical protein